MLLIANRPSLPLLMLLSSGLLLGTEKSTIVRAADLVIIGKLEITSNASGPDGWYLKGTINARVVLYGVAKPGDRITYDFLCSCCRPGIRSELRDYAGPAAIWFLRRRNNRAWTSAGECSDPGLRPLSERRYVERILATQHK